MREDKTIASLGEFGLIKTFFLPTAVKKGGGVIIGIGDDAAVVAVPRTQQLVATTDTLVEGVHFFSDADPFLLGQKALRVNLSDIAAMGGSPQWYLISLTLPPATSVFWVGELARGMEETARQFGVTLIGGDTVSSRGCIVITITLMGLVGKDRGVVRSGAKPGDRILVSGTIGDAALGLALRSGKLTVADAEDRVHLQRRRQLPEPRVDLGVALRDAAISRSAIDISDGLVADLGHLCRASGVGAMLYAEQVPLSPAAGRQVAQHGPAMLTRLLTGGEDYELLFTVTPFAMEALPGLSGRTKTTVTEVGVITKEPGVVVTYNGNPLETGTGGWAHF